MLSLPPLEFAPSQLYSSNTGYVVTANLVNGGLPDLVGIDRKDGFVQVFLNNGDGTFKLTKELNVPNCARVTVGDFNGDGNQDIAVLVSDGNSSSIDIFYGAGDGTFFKNPKIIPLGFFVSDIQAADLTNDGLPDLVLTIARRVAVILNEGGGKFGAVARYNAGPDSSGSLVIGDFNNDGIPDIAVTRFGVDLVAVLLGQANAQGQPTGTFANRILVPVGVNPAALAVGDFNGSGNESIAVANNDYNVAGLQVIIGNGNGTFAKPRAYYGANFVDAVGVGDFNGDGIEDIVTGSFSGEVHVYEGNGDGTFQPFMVIPNTAYSQSFAVGDFTGDGLDDFVSASGFSLRVVLAIPPGTPPPPVPNGVDVTIGAGSSAKSITYRDVSGYVTTIALGGPGSATIDLAGDNLTVNPTGNSVSGGEASIQSIDTTGTTAATTLSIVPQTLNGLLNVGPITTDASLGTIHAPKANLVGNLTIAGAASNIMLGNVAGGAITFGSSSQPVDIRLRNVTNESLDSAQPIGLLQVGEWVTTNAATPGQISAPAIGSIQASDDFSPNLTISAGGLESFDARNIIGGAWTVSGSIGSVVVDLNATLSISAATLGSISALNTLSVVLDTTGDINSIAAGSLLNCTIEAGVGALPPDQRLPDSASEFANPDARIGSVMLYPRVSTVIGFMNSSIAAPMLGSLSFQRIEFANGGMVQGLAADSIRSFSGIDTVTQKLFSLRKPVSLTALAADGISTTDFVLQIIS